MTPQLIAGLRKNGKRWLVSQTLDVTASVAMSEAKIFLLLSHYDDAGMASVHLKAVIDDKYASLIDLEKDIHRKQLEKILARDSAYVVYSSLIRNKEQVEKMAADLYREKYWQFIRQHARSGINPNKSIRPSIQLIFGEIFIVLKYGSETMRTKLADIEKM